MADSQPPSSGRPRWLLAEQAKARFVTTPVGKPPHDRTGVLEPCPDCGALISRDVSGGLLPHHPGLNAGTPNGGSALCPGGRTAYIEGDKLVVRVTS